MFKGLALHTWTLDTTPLADVLRIARTTGWDAVELRRLDFKRAHEAGRSADQVLDLVRTTGLPVACVGVQAGWMFAEGRSGTACSRPSPNPAGGRRRFGATRS